MIDITSAIIAYESGELSPEATVALFQNLVDTGLAWKLQGHYGRVANALLEAGEVTRKPTMARSVQSSRDEDQQRRQS